MLNSLCSSDADSDVLADYVLALIRAESPDHELKSNAIENLEDFLHDRVSTVSLRPQFRHGAFANTLWLKTPGNLLMTSSMLSTPSPSLPAAPPAAGPLLSPFLRLPRPVRPPYISLRALRRPPRGRVPARMACTLRTESGRTTTRKVARKDRKTSSTGTKGGMSSKAGAETGA